MSNKQLVNKLISRAEKKYPREKNFYEFIKLFFQKSSTNELSAINNDDWLTISN